MSALRKRGSTRRWRRIRAFVLARDGFACQFRVDGVRCGRYASHVHHTDPRVTADPLTVDDLTKLAAACADHNLRQGQTPGLDFAPAADRPARRPEWSW